MGYPVQINTWQEASHTIALRSVGLTFAAEREQDIVMIFGEGHPVSTLDATMKDFLSLLMLPEGLEVRLICDAVDSAKEVCRRTDLGH